MQWSVDLHPVTGEWRIIDREGEIVCVSLHGEQHLAKIAAAPDMFEALKAVNKLISEAAITGFNCHDGDWAERLYFSQQATSRALAKAEGRTNLADATPKNPLSEGRERS